MSKKEDFPIDSAVLEDFIKYNKKIWIPIVNEKNESIIINLSMVRMQIPWIIPKILHAKGIQEKTGYKIIALTWNHNDELKHFFNSFGIEHLALNSECKKNCISLFIAIIKTLFFIVFKGKGEDLKEMCISNINIGYNLYEDILRTSSLSTIRSCRCKVVIKKMIHMLWSYYTLKNLTEKNKTKYAIIDDMTYHEGMFIKLFIKSGIRVHACSNLELKNVSLNEKGDVIRHEWYAPGEIDRFIESIGDEKLELVDAFLEEKFQGKNGRDIDRQAFAGKKVLSREELINQYRIDPNKKNVVIMAHTFTDGVFNYGDYYFRDYYDWTEQTLKLASMNPEVNWILKPHPTRSSYNENMDSIENMFEKYKTSNMVMLGDTVSSESIKNIADVIVTIGGNAGAEYACFGIPAIIVGKPYYAGHGYTIEPKSYKEYKEVLSKVSEIESLSIEQIKVAKKVFYFKNGLDKDRETSSYRDEFNSKNNELYIEMCDKMALQYFRSNEGTTEYNTHALSFLLDYIKKNDIKKVEYYMKDV